MIVVLLTWAVISLPRSLYFVVIGVVLAPAMLELVVGRLVLYSVVCSLENFNCASQFWFHDDIGYGKV